MIYEVRTYTLRPGTVAEFESVRQAEAAPREASSLGAFWHTDFGPLNQVIHACLRQPAASDGRARGDGERHAAERTPRRADLIVEQQSTS